MKNHQQGFARVSILILSFITLLVLAGWMYWSFNQNPMLNEMMNEQVSIATSTDETEGWKTYRNEGYGFELQIPESFNVKHDYPDYFAIITGPGGMDFIGLLIKEGSADVLAKDFVASLNVQANTGGGGKLLSSEEVKIGTMTVKKITYVGAIGSNFINYFVPFKGRTMVITADVDQKDTEKIIATIKLTN